MSKMNRSNNNRSNNDNLKWTKIQIETTLNVIYFCEDLALEKQPWNTWSSIRDSAYQSSWLQMTARFVKKHKNIHILQIA